MLILPPDHPLSMKREVGKEKLYNLNFVSLNQNSTSQKFQTQTLKDNGINPNLLHVQMEFNSIEAIKSAVQVSVLSPLSLSLPSFFALRR